MCAPKEQVRIRTERVKTDCNGRVKSVLRFRYANGARKQPEPETEEEQRIFIVEYYAMISRFVDNVGRILDHLDRLGIADDTMVVFFSDHDDMPSEHGYYGGYKPQGCCAATQVSPLIRYPGRVATGHGAYATIDVGVDMPVTLIDLVGAEPFNEANGQIFLPVLDGGDDHRDMIQYRTIRMNDGIWGEFTPVPERGFRTGEWLCVRQPSRREFHSDQTADPHELDNLVDSPGHDSLMDSFDALIAARMDATGDDWDMAASFPPPGFVTHEAARDHLENVLLPRAIEVS